MSYCRHRAIVTIYTGVMQDRDDLPLHIRRRFLSGRPALDFVHTGGDVEHAHWEIINTPEELARWLGLILGVDEIEAISKDLEPMRRLRAAITRSAYAVAAGKRPSRQDVTTINSWAGAPSLIPVLGPDQAVTYVEPTAAAVLSTLARDAIDLFGGAFADRVRVCSSADCQLLFVDTSRPGNRRWCSMQRCGNLAKVRGHRRRRTGDST